MQVQISVDGYIAGPNGEMDWMEMNWDQALKDYVTAITEPVDTIILGRNLAEGFIPYWKDVAANPEHPEHTAGIKFTETPKVVFSRTLADAKWERTDLAKGDLVKEVKALKQKAGSDIIAYGGGKFVSSLIKAGLIDEFHLLVNPTALGSGMPIFEELESKLSLNLEEAKGFACGIALLRYTLKS